MPRAGGIVTDSDAARREILRAVRENLKPRGIAPGSAEPVQSTADPGAMPRGSTARFSERLAAVGAHCTLVSGAAEAAGALAGILSGAGARRVRGPDSPLRQRLFPP